MAKNARTRLVSTTQAIPPSGEKRYAAAVSTEETAASTKMWDRLLNHHPVSTSTTYGTPPATPKGSDRSTRKIATARNAAAEFNSGFILWVRTTIHLDVCANNFSLVAIF